MLTEVIVMSRFNAEAYDKLFPRQVEPEKVETVVSSFTPTTDKLEGKDPDTVEDPATPSETDPELALDPEGGVEDGHAEHSELDSKQ